MSASIHDLKMPSFGADMAEGTLVKWFVQAGDLIKRGDVIAEIETDKGIIDLDVFEQAVVEELLIKQGDIVAVGTAIATLRTPGSTTQKAEQLDRPAQQAQAIAQKVSDTTQSATTEPAQNASSGNNQHFVPATPAARAYALKNNISLHSLQANDADRRIITLDRIKKAQMQTLKEPVQSVTSDTGKGSELPRRGGFDKEAMRRTVSETVARSKKEIPHYYLSQRLDVTLLEQYLQHYNASVLPEQRLLLTAPLLCAITRTLINNKRLNGLYDKGHFTPSRGVHLANAINLRGGGLIMPVIKNAQLLTATTMMQQLKEQVYRARSASLHASELSGGSFTVTSIGDRGAEQMLAVIYPPQVAILALGCVHQEPLIIDAGIQIRTVINATLAADHRVSDGHSGARLLYQLNQKLQEPEELWTVSN